MSVPKGDRSESGMEFVNTADKIEDRAIDVCKNWPKRYMFFITQRTVNLASELYETVQEANAIMPKSEDERMQRIILLEKAMGVNYAFAKKIERAFNKFPICSPKAGESEERQRQRSMSIFEEFMGYCETEDEALKGNLTYVRNMKIGKSEQ